MCLDWTGLALALLAAITTDPALKNGDRFFAAGNYEAAITEYERYLFFNPAGEPASYAYQQIGLAYRNEGDWRPAIEMLRRAAAAAPNDSVKNEREITLAVAQIAAGKYDAAEILLLRVETYTEIPAVRERALFLRGIAALYGFQWDRARAAFRAYVELKGEAALPARIDSLFADAQRRRERSPEAAVWLSTFIPGLGQVYAGDGRSGLGALVLNGSLAYWIAYKALHREYLDAAVIYYFLFRRYYAGNRYHAGRIAREYNQRMRQQEAQTILKVLESAGE